MASFDQPQVFFFSKDPQDEVLPIHVSSIGSRQHQSAVSRREGFPDYQLFRCIDGEGLVKAGDQSFRLSAGTVMLLYPEEPHEYAATTDTPWLVDWICFTCHDSRLVEYLGFPRSGIVTPGYPEKLELDLLQMLHLMNGSRFSVKSRLSALLYQILAELGSEVWQKEDPGRKKAVQKLEIVLTYIEENYDQPLTLGELADLLQITPQYLCQLFKQVLSCRPFQYIQNFRINKSKSLLLEDSTRAVADIAQNCGFENISYFNQLFRKVTGMSPTGFRQVFSAEAEKR